MIFRLGANSGLRECAPVSFIVASAIKGACGERESSGISQSKVFAASEEMGEAAVITDLSRAGFTFTSRESRAPVREWTYW
jgi:hypothetical protein